MGQKTLFEALLSAIFGILADKYPLRELCGGIYDQETILFKFALNIVHLGPKTSDLGH